MSVFKKYFLWIIAILIIALAVLGYYYKNVILYFISSVSLIFLLFKLIERHTKLFTVIQFGNFRLKDDINFTEVIFDKSSGRIVTLYRFIPAILGSIIVTYINLRNPDSFLFTGLSIISVGIALSILTFNYYNSLADGENKKLILSSAKRFYLATIIGIFVLILILFYKNVGTPGFTTSEMFPNLSLSIQNYFQLLIHTFSGLLYLYLLFTSIDYLFEGLFLSLKGTIEF